MKQFTRFAFSIISIILLTWNDVKAQVPTIAPDTTFGTDGVVFNSYEHAYTNLPLAIDVQSTGKIIQAIVSYEPLLALRRYNANGLPDSTFGVNGYAIINPLGTNYAQNRAAIKVLANDNILVCGINGTQNYITRVTAAGTIDSTFGNSNNGCTSLGKYPNIDMKVLSDGTIRIMEYNLADTAMLVKTSANGIIDSSFGINGAVYIHNAVNGICLDHSDRIVTSVNGGIVFRILPDGTVDNTFGTNGYTTIVLDTALTNPLGSPVQTPIAMSDNSITIILHYNVLGNSTFYVAHLFADGAVDANYGNSGLAPTLFGYTDVSEGALALNNGELLVFGQEINQSPGHHYASGFFSVLNASGQQDSVFLNHTASYIYVKYDTTGVVHYDTSQSQTGVGPVVVLPGGQIFQAGNTEGLYPWIAKYDYTGFVAGINNIAQGTDFTIYPNPSSGLCTIRALGAAAEKYTVQTIDITGKEIGERWSFTGGTGTFSVSQYAKGIYLLRVINSQGEQSIRKLMVQ